MTKPITICRMRWIFPKFSMMTRRRFSMSRRILPMKASPTALASIPESVFSLASSFKKPFDSSAAAFASVPATAYMARNSSRSPATSSVIMGMSVGSMPSRCA